MGGSNRTAAGRPAGSVSTTAASDSFLTGRSAISGVVWFKPKSGYKRRRQEGLEPWICSTRGARNIHSATGRLLKYLLV